MTRSRTTARRVALTAAGVLTIVAAVAHSPSNSQVFRQAAVTGLLVGAVYGLVSLGLTLIFGVIDIVNFAHGAFMTIGMYVSFKLVSGAGLDPYLTLLAVVPLLFGCGAVVQRVLLNRIMGKSLESQLLLTLGLSIMIENILLLLFSGTPRAVQTSYGRHSVRLAGTVAELPRVIAFGGALVLAVAVYVVLRRTSLGIKIRAVAQSPVGASLVGIDVDWIYVITFGLGTACVGAAGVFVLPFLSLDPGTGDLFNVIAFIVVVLGGMGSVTGAIVGGFVIGLTQELGGALFPGTSKLLPVFVVFVLVLLLRPAGLFGEST